VSDDHLLDMNMNAFPDHHGAIFQDLRGNIKMQSTLICLSDKRGNNKDEKDQKTT
jgi:hypothetical protein